MVLVLFGLNHATAPLEIRERLSFKQKDSSDVMSALRLTGIFSENLLLSTCNRTEVYGVTRQVDSSVLKLKDLIASAKNFGPDTLTQYGYLHMNGSAVRHLFKVSAGLDSLVLGEVEILGQLKDAYRAATGIDATGPYLNKLFHSCFRVGKRVRSETGISAGGISVGSSAVDLAKKVVGDLKGKRALLIGAGETGQLVARHLTDAGIGDLVITNRTESKAVELAEELGGSSLAFEDYPAQIASFDLVITAVGAPDHVVKRGMFKPRGGLYPLMIDLGVPRDVEPSIEKLPGAIVYHLDDLQAIVNERIARREKEIPNAESIVTEEAGRFISWSDSLRAQSTIADLRKKFEGVKDETLKDWQGRMSSEEFQRVERISRDIINKLLHEPTVNLKGCELEDRKKKCDTCDMFDQNSGCTHGHQSAELKCIITRNIFGISDAGGKDEV